MLNILMYGFSTNINRISTSSEPSLDIELMDFLTVNIKSGLYFSTKNVLYLKVLCTEEKMTRAERIDEIKYILNTSVSFDENIEKSTYKIIEEKLESRKNMELKVDETLELFPDKNSLEYLKLTKYISAFLKKDITEMPIPMPTYAVDLTSLYEKRIDVDKLKFLIEVD